MYLSPDQLALKIHEKQSFLCVGLDPDLSKIPSIFSKDVSGVIDFCKSVIDSSRDHCIAYKPNLAFFEALGPEGMRAFQKVCELIPSEHLLIADAKRGDIGNTANMYAKAFFEKFGVDGITLSPYMGLDTLDAYLTYEKKYSIVLGLTSNPGASDFEELNLQNGSMLYENVIQKCASKAGPEKLMFVVGATRPERFQSIRDIIPDHFLLVPGVGSQGGDLRSVFKNGKNSNIGLIVNSSRSIIYPGGEEADFEKNVAEAAKKVQVQMAEIL